MHRMHSSNAPPLGMHMLQLSKNKKRDFARIKSALYMAFALELVSVWKEFMEHVMSGRNC